MAQDGSVIIGCELATDKFDRQIAQLENKIEKDEKKKIKIQLEIDGIREQANEFNELIAKRDEYAKKIEELKSSAKFLPGTQTLDPAIMEQIVELQNEYDELDSYIEKNATSMQKLADKGNELIEKHKEITNEIKNYKQQIENVKLQKQVAETEKMKQGFGKIGDSIKDAVKKAGKLVLGIFAIRGAYMALRRASSELAGYDKEYASNLEYIRYVLAEAIAPILRGIVQIVATLLNYVFQILNAWFGWNLGKTAKDFESMKKSSGGVADNMKEAEKSAQGFDELNTLQDTSKSTSGGGYTAPGIDLSAMQGQAPEWLQWIIDNKDIVLGALTAILGAIVAVKLGLSGIAGLGIGLAIYGVISLIGDLIDFIKDPSWEKFGKVLKDIGLAITGVGIAIGALTGNWLVAIIGLITTIVGLVIENWDDIQKVLSDVGTWIYDHVIKPVVDFFDAMGKWIYNNVIVPVVGFFDNMFTNIGNFLRDLGTNIGRFFQGIWNGIVNVFSTVGQFFGNVFKGAFEAIKNVFSGIGNFFQGVWNGIVNIFSKIGQKIGDAVSGAFKGAVNAIFTVLENILNFPIRAINGLIHLVNFIPGVNISKIQEFKLPRLKTGGIVNMPNKGTMVGGAIAGESGREGVIPLTDSQAMETLGESIGKYVTINATINNTMDGKLISRHIQKIQSQQAFAGNF